MTGVTVLLLATSLINLGIGVFVFLHQPNGTTNRAFLMFASGTALWIGGFGLLIITHKFLFVPLLNIGGLLLVGGITWFASEFPFHHRLPIRPCVFWLPLLMAGIFIAPYNFIVSDVTFSTSGEMQVTLGPLLLLWGLLLSSYIIFSVRLFIKSYYRAAGEQRNQLLYVFVGMSIFVVSAIFFDVFLPALFDITTLNKIGPLFSLFFVTSTAYAIIRHEFMDIRIVVQLGIIYTLIASIVIAFYIGALLICTLIFGNILNITAPISAAIVILVAHFTTPHIEKRLRKVTDSIFFKDSYVYALALQELSDVLNANIEFERLIEEILKALTKLLRTDTISFYHEESRSYFSPHGNEHRSHEKNILEIEVKTGEKELGKILLGCKRSGDFYSKQDKMLLRTFASYAGVAIHKSELYKELGDYSAQLERKVEERTNYLKQIQEKERELYDDLSHALLTPLTVIVSGVELLWKQPRNKKAYENAGRSAANLSQIARNMLELSRVESRSEEILDTFNLSESINQVIEYVNTIAIIRKISLRFYIAPNIFIKGNSKQITEAFINLLNNAIKYTENCKKRQVRIWLSQRDRQVTLSIEDTGIGIPVEKLPFLFDRFYRASLGDEADGYGLGLAITKRIITAHDGTIEIKSIVNKGTIVIVTLPQA